jgi:hypothetical protein
MPAAVSTPVETHAQERTRKDFFSPMLPLRVNVLRRCMKGCAMSMDTARLCARVAGSVRPSFALALLSASHAEDSLDPLDAVSSSLSALFGELSTTLLRRLTLLTLV